MSDSPSTETGVEVRDQLNDVLLRSHLVDPDGRATTESWAELVDALARLIDDRVREAEERAYVDGQEAMKIRLRHSGKTA